MAKLVWDTKIDATDEIVGGSSYACVLAPRERIVRVLVESNSNYYGHRVIQQLTFETSANRVFGPFGETPRLNDPHIEHQEVEGYDLRLFSGCVHQYLRSLTAWILPHWKNRGWFIMLRSLYLTERAVPNIQMFGDERLKRYAQPNGSLVFGSQLQLIDLISSLNLDHVALYTINCILVRSFLLPESLFQYLCLYL